VAIKVLHASQNAPDELARMAAEARAAQRVASFCTARILRVRLEPPRPYIVSEYIDGLSLQATVDGGDGRPGRRFAGDDLHRLGIGIATALTAIHQAKVVHRDLKPGNVMLGPDGPRLIDFGIARVLDSGTATGGGFVGTLRYMAPEVYAGQRADAEADVFAWGAIMVFAATGEHAFTGGSLPEIAHRIRTHHPDLSMLPERLRPLVAAALAKDPLDRPPARAILAALTEDPREGTGDLHGLVAAGAAQAGLHSRWEPGDPALGKVAEDAYVSLPPQERMLVPEVFLRCLVPGEDGTVSTRPVPAAELFDRQDPAEVQALRRVVGAFPRLLTVTGQGPDEQIVLTRPAVLRAWPRLRSWVAYEGENLAVHHRIRQAARTWADHGRRRSDVLTGAHLDEAVRRATAADRRPVLNQLERGLLDASTRAQAVRSRRVRAVALVLAVTTVLSLAATGWAVRAQQATARQRDIAASRQLAAQSRQFGATRPDMAALLAAAAYRIRRTPESRAALQNIVTGSSRGVLTGYRAHDVAADRTGRYLAIGETDGRTALWDVRAHRQIGRLPRLFSPKGQKSVPASVALSPDGKTLAVSSVESSDGRPVQGRMQLYRVPSLQPFGRPVPVASPYAMVFTSDGGGVAVDDGTAVTVWDVRTQKQRGPRVQYPRGVDTNVLLAPGTVAASSLTEEETFVLQVWDLATGRSTGPFPVPGEAVALSPDGRTVAAQEYKEDDTEHVYVSLWDTRTGRRLGNRVRAPAGAELFSPDGRIVFIGTEPWATARVIRIGSIAPENQESMSFAAFVGERTVASIDDDSKMVRLWDVTVHQPDRSPFRTEPTRSADAAAPVPRALSPDRRTLVSYHLESAAGPAGYRTWDVATGKQTRPLIPAPEDFYRPDLLVTGDGGRVIAAGNLYGEIRAWDSAARRWFKPGVGHQGAVDAMALSPDGRILATGGGWMTETADSTVDGKVRLWDLRSRRPLTERALFSSDTPVTALAFSPDGTTLAAGIGRTVRLWNVADRRPLGPAIEAPTSVVEKLAFAPDNRTLAIGAGRATLLWDVRERRQIGAPLTGHTGKVTALAFSSDVGTLATGGDDGVAKLWDITGQSQIGAPLTGHGGEVVALAFSSDGDTLITADSGETVRRWNIAMPPKPESVACAIAGRTLTRAEWAQYVPSGIDYRDICRE